MSTYSLENAFLEVRDDEESIQRAVDLALYKTVSSVGYSKILTSLGSSLLQALLEGSSTLQYHENQVLMEQVQSSYHASIPLSPSTTFFHVLTGCLRCE